ncbi:hypothetical protein SERLA73DRAFT_151248 [Serpula lacrymans var. lacrymans S7.3]|uniref:Uncharacterized protein n=1 Tax=Serpula lacrymans var. lacrymans (strain S7.3) TaxID=936435 RepID=F8PR78_SERL3|nr:hypothetical protein SERLA73DRAFT_151248 [Serpula lacrymans var. lacrymans S7.3]
MPGNSTASQLSNIITCLQQNKLILSEMIQGVLQSDKPSHKTARELLIHNAQRICTVLHKQLAAHQSVFSWAFGLVSGVLCKEIEELSQEQHGLHFQGKHCDHRTARRYFHVSIREKNEDIAPHLWIVIQRLLKSPNNQHVKLRQNNDEMLAGFAPLVENKLGKLGDTEELARDSEHDEESPMKKSQKRAGARNAALLMIDNTSDLFNSLTQWSWPYGLGPMTSSATASINYPGDSSTYVLYQLTHYSPRGTHSPPSSSSIDSLLYSLARLCKKSHWAPGLQGEGDLLEIEIRYSAGKSMRQQILALATQLAEIQANPPVATPSVEKKFNKKVKVIADPGAFQGDRAQFAKWWIKLQIWVKANWDAFADDFEVATAVLS